MLMLGGNKGHSILSWLMVQLIVTNGAALIGYQNHQGEPSKEHTGQLLCCVPHSRHSQILFPILLIFSVNKIIIQEMHIVQCVVGQGTFDLTYTWTILEIFRNVCNVRGS